MASDPVHESELWEAAQTGDIAKIKELVSSGVNINANGNEKKATALHLAIATKHDEAAEELVRLGADVNAKSDNDVTPLQLAFYNHDQKMTEFLKQHGAKPDILSQLEEHKE